jgi:hypothetical protein
MGLGEGYRSGQREGRKEVEKNKKDRRGNR